MVHAAGLVAYQNGYWHTLWKSLLRSIDSLPASGFPEDVELITFNNGSDSNNGKPMGLLEKQLMRLHTPYTVLGCGISDWRNAMKPHLLLDHLSKTSKKYVLVADSCDVFVVNRLDDLLDRFLGFQCEAVLNCEKSMWPKLPDIQKFEDSICPGSYLNSGLWISTTEFAKEFCRDYAVIEQSMVCRGDQYIYHLLFPKFYPRMQLDYKCHMFQTINDLQRGDLYTAKMF